MSNSEWMYELKNTETRVPPQSCRHCIQSTNYDDPWETSIPGHEPRELQESVSQNTSFPFRSPCLRSQVSGPRETSTQRHDPRGISGDRVTEHKFPGPRETTIQRHEPRNFVVLVMI